ncbi:DUF3606 domain-containing protein [Acerihabitans sp. TG2]|uniref:DUF3606 domain-containing protein n=1 Tax=Acerihabitans sp. TG2 TaxID=3096008 RepID=UPI002B223A15|nr:DUF3606 domain-containing protein [Acerihabitans sp. TG2]MEA9392540.1 DUF3606 domain-containing protein [Acerihabitans sp. TG2]
MSEKLHLQEPQDKNFISLREPWEVEYWTHTLGATKQKISAAIRAVGNGTKDVKSHCGK